MFLVLLTWSSGVWPLVVFVSVPTIALAATVAVRGLRRTWTLFALCGVPMMFALWTRVRTFAWPAAGALVVLSIGNFLLTFDAGARERTLTEFAWTQLVAIYLWTKGRPSLVLAADQPAAGARLPVPVAPARRHRAAQPGSGFAQSQLNQPGSQPRSPARDAANRRAAQ